MPTFSLLHYAIIFLVVALIAAAVGFGGVAGVAMEGARLLFWIFIVLFVISLVEPCPPRLAPPVVARTLCHSGSADVMTRKLVCAKHFDPAVFMGESWSTVEEDERAERLTEIDVSAIGLVSCLKKDDDLPTGDSRGKPQRRSAKARRIAKDGAELAAR